MRDLICLQMPPNAVKYAQSNVVAQSLSKQHETKLCFQYKEASYTSVICLDRKRITKTQQCPETSQLRDIYALKLQRLITMGSKQH